MTVTQGTVIGTRWTARLWSLASLALVGLFFIGSVANEGFAPSGAELLLFLCFPIGVLAGLALAWWRELIGGVTAIASVVAFYALHAVVSGGLPGGPYFVLLAFPGVLFLVAALLGKEQVSKGSP